MSLRPFLRAAFTLLGLFGCGLGLTTLASRPEGLISVLIWLAVGVVVHDAVVAPATQSWAWLSQRRDWPSGWGLLWLLWGSATLLALPVLVARLHATLDPDFARSLNDTELNTPTLVVWLLGSAIALATMLLSRRTTGRQVNARRGSDGDHLGGR